jgi:hypothetical protein
LLRPGFLCYSIDLFLKILVGLLNFDHSFSGEIYIFLEIKFQVLRFQIGIF